MQHDELRSDKITVWCSAHINDGIGPCQSNNARVKEVVYYEMMDISIRSAGQQFS